MRRTLAGVAVPAVTVATAAAVLAAGSGSAAAASGPTAADKAIATKLGTRFPAAHLGTNAGGLVRDVASGRTVWAKGSTKALMPASTEKLATAAAVLRILGPSRTVRTRVRLSGHTLYLVGGGDMHLTTANLNALAGATATALKARKLTSVTLRVDDSLFPAPALSPGWSSGYYPSTLAPVRALALLGDRVTDTSLHAGQVFARQLGALGVHASAPARAKAPASAVQLAYRTSAPLATAVEYMLKNSDNNVAEGVARLAALATHRAANWRGVTATVRAALTGYHVPTSGTVAYDASGLSRKDRMTAATLAYLASLAVDPRYHGTLWPMYAGLPVAGKDGTLSKADGRFTTRPSNCAVGKLEAKTGTLTGAVALAGVAKAKDGRWKSFAFVENGSMATSTARRALDGLAATVVGCW